jgi:hypothetical protein
MSLVLLIASGCAPRADWIEGTLVTVDVTGRWTGGTWSQSAVGGGTGGAFEMTLRQTGPKMTGDVSLTGGNAHFWSGPIEGTVTGDVLKFSRPDGRLRGEVIVAGDEMSGAVDFGSGTKPLRLQRQPGGRPESR